MPNRDETLKKAYGSIPKEVGYDIDWNWLPATRGIKYYWLRVKRFFTR